MHCKGACMKPLLDVLMILDALEKEGSFAAASAKLYKTPSALSYTVHKLESDLNIQLLDRSGHRAKFTRTGKMLLEKGREVLHTVRELEKQAIKLHEGWENELVIGVDDTFPFSLLAPLIEAFYQHHSVTRLKFINGVLGGSLTRLLAKQGSCLLGALTNAYRELCRQQVDSVHANTPFKSSRLQRAAGRRWIEAARAG